MCVCERAKERERVLWRECAVALMVEPTGETGEKTDGSPKIPALFFSSFLCYIVVIVKKLQTETGHRRLTEFGIFRHFFFYFCNVPAPYET